MIGTISIAGSMKEKPEIQVAEKPKPLNPLIIEVFVDPDERLFPKVQAHIADDGKITSMPIEDMSPLLPIEELKLALKYAKIKKESYQARGFSSEA